MSETEISPEIHLLASKDPLEEFIAQAGLRPVETARTLDEIVRIEELTPEFEEEMRRRGVKNPRTPTRGELMEAGYVFNNFIGRAEKPIVEGVVGDRDFSRRPLLTRDDVDYLLATDQSELEGIPASKVADDMWRFLGGLYIKFIVREHLMEELKEQAKRLIHSSEEFLGGELESLIDEAARQRGCADHRGISLRQGPMNRPGLRLDAARNQPCPFLECNHAFVTNFDWSIPADLIRNSEGLVVPARYLRINSIGAHLASHGISERGIGGEDQRYITLAEYVHSVFADTPEKRDEQGFWTRFPETLILLKDLRGLREQVRKKFIRYGDSGLITILFFITAPDDPKKILGPKISPHANAFFFYVEGLEKITNELLTKYSSPRPLLMLLAELASYVIHSTTLGGKEYHIGKNKESILSRIGSMVELCIEQAASVRDLDLLIECADGEISRMLGLSLQRLAREKLRELN